MKSDVVCIHLKCKPAGHLVKGPLDAVVLNGNDRPAVAAYRMVVMVPVRVCGFVPGNGSAQIDFVHQM